LERQNASDDAIAETTQVLRERLLLGTERDAGLMSYAGRGSLSSWLRAVSVRTYLNSLRDRRELPEDKLETLIDPSDDPEAAYLRSKNAQAFKEAFYAAVRTLNDRDKTLLCYFYVDGLSLDEIAPLLGTSRASVHRWLSVARSQVVDVTQERLRRALGPDAASLPSLRRGIVSDFEITLQRLFA
jgi:RNA polymerase sigma-70 factor